jgi:hypothetical protein
MSKPQIPSSNELWKILLGLSPDRFNGGYPDIEMLRDRFQKYSNEDASQFAKLSFQKAIDNWDEKSIREFVDLLTENQIPLPASSEECHDILIKVYKIIFEP